MGQLHGMGAGARVVLVTGGAGFIGSAFLHLVVPQSPEITFVNLDALTYAGHPMNCAELEGLPNYRFVHADLRDPARLRDVFATYHPDAVVHFAAESHVDRSIAAPADFVSTNILGTFHLLECCREFWSAPEGQRFLHISTDEVYGTLGEYGQFTETSPYAPRSPYAASKASADHLVQAYLHTYGLPAMLTHASNNYGPRQFPEKMIPLMLLQALAGKPLPVYGDGGHVRDWLYVEDHCRALWAVLTRGQVGATYNIGGGEERTNLEVVRSICRLVARMTERDPAALEGLITLVADRPGHDRRYALDTTTIRRELGWAPRETFDSGLEQTLAWYLAQAAWVDSIRSGAYRDWVATHYGAQRGVAI